MASKVSMERLRLTVSRIERRLGREPAVADEFATYEHLRQRFGEDLQDERE